MAVGFYQCVAAIPAVYNVLPPPGLEEYTQWLDMIALPSDLQKLFITPSCFGDYRKRLLYTSLWPLVALVSLAMCCIAFELLPDGLRKWMRLKERPRGTGGTFGDAVAAAVTSALWSILPTTLALTFFVVPSTGTQVFRSFLCDAFESDASEVVRFLNADLAVSCDSPWYRSMRGLAILMLVLWPVGVGAAELEPLNSWRAQHVITRVTHPCRQVPMLYTVLLSASRESFRQAIPTALSRALSFLTDDYVPAFFWW